MHSTRPRHHRSPYESVSRNAQPTKGASISGYMTAAAATAAALFFVLWWMLQSEENPWVPAGLAASVVMLVAASAREVVMRRAWARHVLEQDRHHQDARRPRRSSAADLRLPNLHAEALRGLQKRSAEAD